MHPNWKALCTADIQWKQFVREGTSESDEPGSLLTRSGIGGITGGEAKQFYEDVIHSVSHHKAYLDHKADDPVKECQTKSASFNKKYFDNKERWLNTLFKEAQNNNTKEVEKLLQFTNSNINEQDFYGWTALMSACYAGAVDVTQLLLAHGADTRLKDRVGNSCFSLAKSKGRQEIINILSKRGYLQQYSDVPSSDGETVQFYCEECKMSFAESSKQQHYTSTVHLFNSKPEAPVSTSYLIPCTNRGYQILLKSGWDKNSGLGPEGAGRKFPLKTVLKRDRRGLGDSDSKRKKACVTHFGPRETDAVNRVISRDKNKYRREAELHKVRQKERAWRREFADTF